MEKLVYEKNIVVSVHETGVMGEIKPSAIMQYFQDVATEHAEILGLGRKALLQQNLFWVVTSISAEIFREAEVGEELTLRTWPHPPGTVSTQRDYYILDTKGGIIVKGVSKWSVLDTRTHLPKRVAPLFKFDKTNYNEIFAIEGDIGKIPKRDTSAAAEKRFEVRNCELDTNFHMNNARYGDIIYNITDPNIYREHVISRFDIDFLHEIKAGSSYDVTYLSDPSSLYIEVFTDGKECARMSADFTDRNKLV